MKVYDAAAIRNVALVGHTGSGKTQLASAMLSDAGMVNRFGKVDEGTTVTDYDEEEIARKHTLTASLAFAEWNRQKINVIDTPGIGNFLSDARAGLQVADAALIVVDAVGGVMVQTEKVWEAATDLNLPRLVILNRLDRERASLERALQSLRDACSRTVIPVQLPIGEEKSFKGVVDLVTKKAYTFETNESGKFTEAPIPASMASHRGGNRCFRELPAFVRLERVGLFRDQVDDTFERFLFADRQLNRNHRPAARVAQRLKRPLEAGPLAVEAVENHETRQVEVGSGFPHFFRLHHH